MSNHESTTQVTPHCWVKLRGFEPIGEIETFYLVDEHEVDLLENRIGTSNPLAQVLIGASVGDTVTYEPPGGKVELTIVDAGPC